MISGVKNGVVGLTEFRFFFFANGEGVGGEGGSGRNNRLGVVLGLRLGKV